jgi:hypothetical protein
MASAPPVRILASKRFLSEIVPEVVALQLDQGYQRCGAARRRVPLLFAFPKKSITLKCASNNSLHRRRSEDHRAPKQDHGDFSDRAKRWRPEFKVA